MKTIEEITKELKGMQANNECGYITLSRCGNCGVFSNFIMFDEGAYKVGISGLATQRHLMFGKKNREYRAFKTARSAANFILNS
jgi:hypothetical protein